MEIGSTIELPVASRRADGLSASDCVGKTA